MKILVIGSGAREHALVAKLASDGAHALVCAPGNGGIAALAQLAKVDVESPAAIVALAVEVGAELVVVGPEAPLVAGAADALRAQGILVFGPSKAGARLEGSKAFSKEFMARHGIPTAGFRVFDDAAEATRYVREAGRPLVVKADGLAAGKGVVVAKDADEAAAAIEDIMVRRSFGSAGDRVVVEETLRGQEVSYHVVADGVRYVAMAPAQDHKRIGTGDVGPNTGGMGAYSPPPVVTADVEARILREVVEPTLAGMAAEGTPFQGALFVGLMIEDGVPRVLEFNTRFGDPECEVMMARWKGSVLPLLLGSARGDLGGVEATWEAPAAMTVVLAAAGYPATPRKGDVIAGLEEAARTVGVSVLHAGTARADAGIVTSGGRVLAVTAIGADVDEAAERAYAAVASIRFEGMQFRTDIGHHARRS